MSRIHQISIKHFKAISALEVDFKGCTAIVTGGNNKGKTSFLRGIPDRLRFVRPEVMVQEGADSGSGVMSLSTGERFEWEFDNSGKDKVMYITSDGVKQSVTKEVSKRFFPPTFDIDKFLMSSPKEQSRQLQQIIGIDFTDIDKRYKIAYDDRTEKNRDAEKYHAKLIEMLEVPKVDPVDISSLQSQKETERTRLNNLYLENKAHNDKLRAGWNEACKAEDEKVHLFNYNERERQKTRDSLTATLDLFKRANYPSYADMVQWIDTVYPPQQIAIAHYPAEPVYIEELPDNSALLKIDEQILQASITNQKAAEYKNYIEYKRSVEEAKGLAEEADILVKSIEAERELMIQRAQFPQGIAITPDGITVDGFPLDRNQISTSKLYTAALRIAAMNLGEVRTLHFDASFLDRHSLAEIEQWAESNDLQLLIERPDFDGGEIKFELIEH